MMDTLPNMTCYRCGSKARLCYTIAEVMQPRYQIFCPNCGTNTTPSFEIEKAIQKWRDIQIAQVMIRHQRLKGGTYAQL